MKKLIALLCLVATAAWAQSVHEVVLVDGKAPIRSAWGNTNLSYTSFLGPTNSWYTYVTNTSLLYTNYGRIAGTNKIATIPVTTCVVRIMQDWNTATETEAVTFYLQKSYDKVNWEEAVVIATTAGDVGDPAIVFTNLTLDAYNFLRVSNIVNASTADAATNLDVRVYYKAVN